MPTTIVIFITEEIENFLKLSKKKKRKKKKTKQKKQA